MNGVHSNLTKMGDEAGRSFGTDQASRGKRRRAKVRLSDADRYMKLMIANGFPPTVELVPDGRVRLLPMGLGGSGVGGGDPLRIGELNDVDDDGQVAFEAWRRRHDA